MDKIRVAMIGCGGFQRHRISNLLRVPEAEIVALVDPEPEQIRLTLAAHPSTSSAVAFENHRDMLEKVMPDAVMIATPHTQHVGQILDSLAAGAHVCCEKPLVTSVKDAVKVIDARDKAQKVAMVSYQRHFQAEYRFIRESIQSGKAGPVQFVAALQGQGWLRATRGTWRQVKSLSGGGQLNDSGSHLIDVILWSTGLSAQSVSAYGDSFDTEVDINTALSMRFTNGALGTFSVVGNGFGWHEDVSIFCEETVFYMRETGLTMVDRKDNKFKAERLTGGSTPDQNFIDAILGRAECESPFECGLEVIRLTEAAWKSIDASGQAMAI